MNIHTFIDTLAYSESINDIIINIFMVHLAFLIGTFFFLNCDNKLFYLTNDKYNLPN